MLQDNVSLFHRPFVLDPVLKDDADATSYAQPLFEYNLKVSAVLTDFHTLEGLIRLQDQIEVPNLAISEAFPPYDIEDRSSDFAVKQTHLFQTSKLKFQKFVMELNAEEPALVLIMEGQPTSTTEVKIHMTATAPADDTDMGGFATTLQRMRFKIAQHCKQEHSAPPSRSRNCQLNLSSPRSAPIGYTIKS